MLIETAQARLLLQPGQLARLHLAPQARLRGLSGHAWITFDNDRRDVVLGPGDEFVADGRVPAIASALRGREVVEVQVST